MSHKRQHHRNMPYLLTATLIAGGLSVTGAVHAQEELNFAHVYETSEPLP
ncbi:hypothetical protein HSBAA_57370 [Vreelandella sulfidaeris]|uniref:Uncharacterized protein n=1 Tax=Vreelandella sulfidaeris TaxID=115553 RepID=A0A455UID7_9GAMM|nr:hypothetical protein HSBAA_57370 [Halomonas sulfidaeris]